MKKRGPENKPLLLIALTSLAVLLLCSCRKKESAAPETSPDPATSACDVKYNSAIKPLVSMRCAISGCHVAGAATGDFSTYQGLKSKTESGQLDKMVFDLKVMPPSNAVQLSAAELDQLKCWISNGALQN